MMKIILKEDVPNLGVVGDLVSVRDGYARNFLIPEGKASFASVRSIHELEHQKRLATHRRKLATNQAQADKQRIEALSICLQAKVAQVLGEDASAPEKLQKLFGSVGARDLARVLQGLGVQTEHRRVTLSDPVRTVGRFTATIRLDGGVSAVLPFWVIPEGVADVEAEKKRVEAAQEASQRRVREDAEAELKARAAAAVEARQEALAREAKAAAESEYPPAEEEIEVEKPAGGKGKSKGKAKGRRDDS